MGSVAIVIPAAGQSRRMEGADKLLRPVDGVAQLRRTALFALSSGARVLVTLPPGDSARRASLGALDVTILDVPDHLDGLSASLRAAERAARPGEALMILPADMPEITPEALARLLRSHAAAPLAILRGSQDERPGHPVLVPADLVPEIAGLSGDAGARVLLDRHTHRVRKVPLAGASALLDLDTAQDWAGWERARPARRPGSGTLAGSAAGTLAAAARAAPGSAVLAVITGVHGASARSPGAMMCLCSDGSMTGSLTNGCIEADLALHARAVRSDSRPVQLRYGQGSPYFDIRLPCGGGLDVSLFPAPSGRILADIACLAASRGAAALEFGAEGTARLGPGRPTGWAGDRFIVNLPPAPRLMLVGEGAEVAVLSDTARAAGYDVELLPTFGATRGLSALREADPWTAVVTLLHDHDAELPILAEALTGPAFYIGALGSRRVAERRKEALARMGLSPTQIARIHGPAGLIPSARDPGTLAISVLAEVAQTARATGAMPA